MRALIARRSHKFAERALFIVVFTWGAQSGAHAGATMQKGNATRLEKVQAAQPKPKPKMRKPELKKTSIDTADDLEFPASSPAII